MDLTPALLEAIETSRDGGEAHFWLTLWPSFTSATGYLNTECRPIQFTVPRDRWLRVLEVYYSRPIAVIELVCPDALYLDFKAASAHLAYANERLMAGGYDEAVGACRRALEAVAKALDVSHKSEDLKAALTPVTDPQRAAYYAGIVTQLKHLAGHSIHRAGAPDVYTRGEARFILGVTSHAVALLGRLLPKPPRAQ